MSFAYTSATQRQFLPPAVAVSSVAFAIHPPTEAHLETAPHDTAPPRNSTLWIPLVRRTRPPFDGAWALPGGPIPWDESLGETALRTLHSAVHRAPSYLEQLYSFGARERSAQAQRLVTIAYWALYGERELAQPPSVPNPTHSERDTRPARWDDAPPARKAPESSALQADPNVSWFAADRLPELAFDHAAIVSTALQRLRMKTEYAAVAHRFLGDTFSLAQLREVHEAVRGAPADPGNFRRQALAQGNLIETGQTTTGSGHRPAKLYRFTENSTGITDTTEPPHDHVPQTPTATTKRTLP